MKKWEYHLLRGRWPTTETLNGFGKGGWELVAIVMVEREFHCYFKRRIE